MKSFLSLLPGFLSTPCVFWDKDTTGSQLSAAPVAQGETECSFLILILKSKGRSLIKPAVLDAHPAVEGCRGGKSMTAHTYGKQ